ncbi:hypothetical protein CDAR_206081 [Caerostris darwini]|uniref:Uncharacterized protein n=1 Tax=Caerostris darwini TaxID=1538125 RepID=A0AAV4VXB3_9ARAC|nr:hypothetical protein CDAR_206081 [Caerostris darwini]
MQCTRQESNAPPTDLCVSHHHPLCTPYEDQRRTTIDWELLSSQLLCMSVVAEKIWISPSVQCTRLVFPICTICSLPNNNVLRSLVNRLRSTLLFGGEGRITDGCSEWV